MKKHLKSILALSLIIIIGVFSLTACGKKANEPEKATEAPPAATEKAKVDNEFIAPSGLPALVLSVPGLAETKIDGETYEYKVLESPDLLASELMPGKKAAAIVPANMAATLYNKAGNYKIAATGGWGSFYLASSDKQIQTLENLKDQTLTANGKNLVPDLVLRQVLTQSKIKPDEDVKINYLGTVNEVASAFMADQADAKIALLAEPGLSNVLNKKENVNVVADMNALWQVEEGTNFGYPQSCLIVHKDLDDAKVKALVKAYEDAIAAINEDPEGSAKAAADFKVTGFENFNLESAERANLSFADNSEKAIADYDKFFKVIADKNPDAIGGKIPDENIFWQPKAK